ncbi:MAG: DUF1801 domain-containing protein, partial [Polyangiaceae bacterium]
TAAKRTAKVPSAKKAATARAATKRATTKRAATQRRSSKRTAMPAAVKGAARSNGAKRAATSPMAARRADFGAPIDGFFAKQPPQLRSILEALRTLVEKNIPDATAALKWGMPMYTIGRTMVCGLGGHKAHVNLILAGPKGSFVDPQKRLTGEGKTGQHLKLRTLADLPRESVTKWLRAAADLARAKD